MLSKELSKRIRHERWLIMKKKIKVSIGAILFIVGVTFAVSGVLCVLKYFDSVSGLLGTVAVALGIFGVYYGRWLMKK